MLELSDRIASDEFAWLARHPKFPKAFTRNRKLPLPALIAALLSMRGQSQQTTLDSFFASVCGTEHLQREVSDRAFAKARDHLHLPATASLNDVVVHRINEAGLIDRWCGLRVVAAYASMLMPAGLVVGSFPVSLSTDFHAFTWTPQAGVRDIGALVPVDTAPSGVNSRGQVAMSGYNSGTGCVYDTQGDVLTTLPLLDGRASAGLSDINDDGVIVGAAGCANVQCAAAWFPTPHGYEVRDLNSLIDWPAGREPVFVSGAYGLNNRGQIVEQTPGDVLQSFVLTPE